MSNTRFTLAHFLESVPVCQLNSQLETVLALFQSGKREVVAVINAEKVPLGVIHPRALITYLLEQLLVPSAQSLGMAPPSLAALELNSLMTPIASLPAQMTVEEFCPHLQAKPHNFSSPQAYALVNSAGEFLGLLNCRNLLTFLLSTKTGDSPQFSEHLLSKELAAKNTNLAQANRLKDEFLETISHQLKSPLTAVVGLASLLKQQKVGQLNHRQSQYAELIYQNSRQLMVLANDILDFTHLETGQLRLNPVPLNIADLCQQAYTTLAEKYPGKIEAELSFSLEIEPELETLVGDELRLEQMLVNLLDNALKFTPAGGKFGLKVQGWTNWITFTVWDTGMGITEDLQPLLLEKFHCLESPLTHQFDGTGLGLVLTARLARAHGGEISFISQVNQGSQFTLFLPATPRWESSEKLNQPSPFLALIVESIPQAIADLREKLLQLNYQVVIARSGTDALEKARQLQPERIFLNPSLPLLSGWDVLTLLKCDSRTKKIPVIVTAPATEWQLSRQEDVDGWLALPVQQSDLAQILAQGNPSAAIQSLTILRLEPTSTSPLDWLEAQMAQLAQLNYRILEASDLEQAEMLASVWQVDAVILDGEGLEATKDYLQSLRNCQHLAPLPLITLDEKTTALANQIPGLAVFPCLLPRDKYHFNQLLQVIQIAVGMVYHLT
jgi:signal transduction histidine kinase/CheY-like chemotaxis protein